MFRIKTLIPTQKGLIMPFSLSQFRGDLMYCIARTLAVERAKRKLADFQLELGVVQFDSLSDLIPLFVPTQREVPNSRDRTIFAIAIMEEYERVLPLIARRFDEIASLVDFGAIYKRDSAEAAGMLVALGKVLSDIENQPLFESN